MDNRNSPYLPKRLRDILVYVAGPFRAPSAWEIEQNIRRAEELALRAWKAGLAVICPHANTRYYQGAAPDETWLDGDLTMISRCDALLLVPNWYRSEGTIAEVDFAHARKIPVFESLLILQYWASDQISRRL